MQKDPRPARSRVPLRAAVAERDRAGWNNDPLYGPSTPPPQIGLAPCPGDCRGGEVRRSRKVPRESRCFRTTLKIHICTHVFFLPLPECGARCPSQGRELEIWGFPRSPLRKRSARTREKSPPAALPRRIRCGLSPVRAAEGLGCVGFYLRCGCPPVVERQRIARPGTAAPA